MQATNYKLQITNNRGQTLIEVIIAVGLVTLVLLTLVSALVLAIRNNQFAKDQVLARNRARETQEWLRSIRSQMGWDAFYAMVVADSPPVTYCLPTLPSDVATTIALVNANCPSNSVIVGTKYKRTLVLSVPNSNEIDALVTISWIDGGKTHESQSTLILKNWL